MDLIEAIQQRHACRAFLPEPVPDATISALLDTARWAPSGVNTQPWHVHVVKNPAKQRLSTALIQARRDGLPTNPDYAYYPSHWRSPYAERRKDCGITLYKTLGIEKGDPDGQMRAWNNNYTFFGADVGLIFTLDDDLNTGSWLDMGMFLQNLMLAALAFDLATCPQASLAEYPDIIRQQLGLDAHQQVICGMALGYPDTQHPVNQYRLARVASHEFAHWYTD